MNGKRTCGGCTACCKLVPVAEIGKAAFTKCELQTRNGCRVYSNAPRSCKGWSCAWLVMPEGETLPRPDRAGYVVDMLPDYITSFGDDGSAQKLAVVQVWLDPGRLDALKAPSFLRFLAVMGERYHMGALVRQSGKERDGQSCQAILITPPAVNGSGRFIYGACELGNVEPQHSVQEVTATLRELGLAVHAELGGKA